MEKSVYDVTGSIRHHQQGLTTSESIDVEGMFVVKLRALFVQISQQKTHIQAYIRTQNVPEATRKKNYMASNGQ